jgi:predicted RND superfamily exporter protein
VLTGPRLINELQERYPSLTKEEILRRLKGSLIGPDNDKTCLVVTLTEEAKGKNLRPMLEEIRKLARQCNIEPELEVDRRNVLVKAWDAFILGVREMIFGREPPGEGIRMGGTPVDNVAIDVEGERTLFRLASLSLFIGLGISMACFRSWRLTLMVIWTALLSAGVGLAAVFWTGSSVDAVMLSMPSLVYVLAISGAVHIINYYHDAIRDEGLPLAVEQGLAHGWLPCTLAAVTTAIGLGSLYMSHVVPISKFGVYSAIGVLATLGLLFLLLPAMLSYFPSRKYAQQHGGKGETESSETVFVRWWRVAGGLVIRHNLAVSVGCGVVMALLALGLYQIKTSVKLMKLFSSDAEIIHHYRWLEDNLGPLVPMEVVIKIDNAKCDLTMLQRMRLARQVERTIEAKLDAVGGALCAATLAPDIRPSRRRTSGLASILGADLRRDRDYVLNKRLEEHRSEFRDYLTVDADATLDKLGITGQVAARLRATGLDTLEKIERYGEGKSIAENLASISSIDADDAAQVEEAVRRWESEHGWELWRVCARVDALSDLDYATFVDDLKEVVEPVLSATRQDLGFKEDEGEGEPEGIRAVYTGVVPLVYQTQHELMRGLFNSLAMAFVLIAFVMMLVLKSPGAGLVAMIPNLFPVVVIFGIMGWSGILVDVGTMMTASVALGVAVDDTIHYLTWFRRGLDEGLDRKGAAIMAYERCATAMTQTTLIGGLGLAAFAFSTFTPTQRFGTLMLVLLAAALFGDLVFLPALLTGPLGRVFDPSGKKKKAAKASSADETPAGESASDVAAAMPNPSPPVTRHLRKDSPHRSRRSS